MVIPFASLATPQTPEYAATRWAGAALGTSRCCKSLVVNDTTAHLAPWPAPKAVPAYVTVIHSRALRHEVEPDPGTIRTMRHLPTVARYAADLAPDTDATRQQPLT